MVYPQEEIYILLSSIEDTLLKIALSKDDNVTTCRLLSSMSLDIQKISVLFKHAKKLNRMTNLIEEKKKFLRFVSTIEHWAKFKNWGELCNSVGDVGDELLTQIVEIGNLLEKTVQKRKKRNDKDGSLVSSDEFSDYKNRVEQKRTGGVRENREKLDALKQNISRRKEFEVDEYEYPSSKLPAIFSLQDQKEEPKKRSLWPF